MSDLLINDVPQAGSVQVRDALDAIGVRRSIRWYEPNKPVERFV